MRRCVNASRGQRNDTLNAASYRVGRAVASGWVDENAATRMLTQAAATNGLVGDDGLRSVEATIRSGLQAGMQKPLEPLQDRELRLPGAIVTGLDNVGRPKSALHWHGNDNDATTPRWLVKKMLLQSGVAIMSGQWSSGKTFVALELAYCVAMGEPFAGRLVKRPGGTLFFAAEAEGDIPIRLRGLVTERSQDPSTLLPFAWVGEMPRLRDPEAANHLAELAHEAADGMKDKFGVELALIVIDTMAAAAGFDNENDASEAQQVMTVLHALARQTGALVLVVDHFGKDADRGTRGSIAKESSADNVLALLADQRLTGAVSGRTLVLRKLRGGVTGYQVAFELAPVKLGVDEDGDEITTCVVRFLDGPVPRNASGAVWNRLQDLRQAVDVGLGISRQKLRPFGADGPLVEATPLDTVRMEFYRAYPAEGDDQHQRKDARRKAFWRKLGKAKERGLVATRDIDGVDWIWFASSDSAHANQRGNPPSFAADVGCG